MSNFRTRKEQVRALFDAVGRDRLAQALGLSKKSVYAAGLKGRIPAHWRNEVEALAEEAGVDCPSTVFRAIGGAGQLASRDSL